MGIRIRSKQVGYATLAVFLSLGYLFSQTQTLSLSALILSMSLFFMLHAFTAPVPVLFLFVSRIFIFGCCHA